MGYGRTWYKDIITVTCGIAKPFTQGERVRWFRKEGWIQEEECKQEKNCMTNAWQIHAYWTAYNSGSSGQKGINSWWWM